LGFPSSSFSGGGGGLPSRSFMMNAPRAMRTDLAGGPRPELRIDLQYAGSNASHGMHFAGFYPSMVGAGACRQTVERNFQIRVVSACVDTCLNMITCEGFREDLLIFLSPHPNGIF